MPTSLTMISRPVRRCTVNVACVLGLALGGVRATAQEAQAHNGRALEDLLATLDAAPARVNVIAGIPDGQAVLTAMKAEGENIAVLADALAQASGAWKALADAMGWEREEMTVALLGGSVVLMGHAQGVQAELAEWSLRCTVTAETEARLTKRLDLFPRQIVEGQPVFSIENGRYVLALQRSHGTQARQAAQRAQAAPGRAIRLIVSPADEPNLALFADVLRASGQGQRLHASPDTSPAPAIASLRSLGDADAFVLVRDAPDPGDHAPPDYLGWGTHRIAAYAGEPHDGVIRFVVRDHRLVGARERLAMFAPAAFEPWSDGAAVSIVIAEAPWMPSALQPWLLGVLDALDLPALPGATARLTAWSARPREGALGLSISATVQAVPGAESARALDAVIEQVMGTIEPMSGAQGRSWDAVRGLADVAPAARREVPVSLPAKGYGAQVFGAESLMRWQVQDVPADLRIGQGWDGWMLAGLVPAGAPAFAPPAAAPADQPARAWICRAALRVDLLTRAMPSIMPILLNQTALAARVGRDDLAALSASMGVLSEIEFESWLDEERDDVGHAALRVRVDPAKAVEVRRQRTQQRK